MIQVQTCWDIGRHIVEFEQGGATRARYGQRLLPTLARTLTAEYGNLRHMRAFFLAFPIRDALRRELSWSGELTHQDIGQMDMYVRMYDELKRGPDDNPTVGIILCSHKDASIVRYSVLHGHEQLFASKYKLVLPSEEELRAELERERTMLDAKQALPPADFP